MISLFFRFWNWVQCRFGRALDIRLCGRYPANVLSNLYGNSFTFDGVRCGSMEGFLQSLKVSSVIEQVCICRLKGTSAKRSGRSEWIVSQQLYWQGVVMDRQSEEYQRLLRRVYVALYRQNEQFREALHSTRGKRLCHTIGGDEFTQTILTRQEFLLILNELRQRSSNNG